MSPGQFDLPIIISLNLNSCVSWTNSHSSWALAWLTSCTGLRDGWKPNHPSIWMPLLDGDEGPTKLLTMKLGWRGVLELTSTPSLGIVTARKDPWLYCQNPQSSLHLGASSWWRWGANKETDNEIGLERWFSSSELFHRASQKWGNTFNPISPSSRGKTTLVSEKGNNLYRHSWSSGNWVEEVPPKRVLMSR